MTQLLLEKTTLDSATAELHHLLDESLQSTLENNLGNTLENDLLGNNLENNLENNLGNALETGLGNTLDKNTLENTGKPALRSVLDSPQIASPGLSSRKSLWVWGWRLSLLGFLGTGAILGGAVLAHFYPGQVSEMPLLERGLRQTAQGWQMLRAQPHRLWTLFSKLQAQSTGNFSELSLPSDLTEDDRQQLVTELNRLQTELNSLSQEINHLEAKLGITTPEALPTSPKDSSTASLESRLATIAQTLTPNPGYSAENSGLGAIRNIAVSNDLAAEGFRLTLPTDLLFKDGEAALQPQAQALLDAVVVDLQSYGPVNVAIATHTDNIGDPETNQHLSFQRSQAVARYLQTQLDSSYQWTVLGYGETQPLADNSTNTNRQRNRRLEITLP